MSNHAEKTREQIMSAPAPRNIEWTHFITMWENYADHVEQESGDRLAVEMNGHRVVFRREKDGVVGIEDIERARHLFSAHESTEGKGRLFVVTVDEKGARTYDFDLDAHDVETTGHEHQTNPDSRARRMRTVEKKTGHDTEHDLVRFFDDLAADLKKNALNREFVLLGHGAGKSNAAHAFGEYLAKRHPDLSSHLVAEGTIDLSAATEADIESAAQRVAGR